MSSRWLIAVSMSAHVVLGTGIFVAGIWRIEQLAIARPGRVTPVMAMAEPAPGGEMESRSDGKIEPKPPRLPTMPRTPHPRPDPPEKPAPSDGGGSGGGPAKGPGDPESRGECLESCGEQAGSPVCGDGSLAIGETCDDGNTESGDGCSASCRIETPPPPPKIVAPTVLQGLRISGDTQPRPSSSTMNMMIRDGATTVRAAVYLCVGTSGNVTSAELQASTRYEAYDTEILRAVRGWRYQPYKVNDRAVPACSVVTFVYSIR